MYYNRLLATLLLLLSISCYREVGNTQIRRIGTTNSYQFCDCIFTKIEKNKWEVHLPGSLTDEQEERITNQFSKYENVTVYQYIGLLEVEIIEKENVRATLMMSCRTALLE